MACKSGDEVKAANKDFDAEAWAQELRAARDATRPSTEEEDAHLFRLELITCVLGVVGLLLAMRGVVSPLAMMLFGYYKYGKFAILAHHTLHGGWGRSRRGWFAQGAVRRVIDWLDWIFPMGWIVEHNKFHHYRLNEDADPDFVQRNTVPIQNYPVPLAGKYLIVAVQACIWKWFYYASNTLKLLHAGRADVPKKEEFDDAVTIVGLIKEAAKGNSWHRAVLADLLLRVMALPFLFHFVLPSAFAGWIFGHSTFGLPFCWITAINLAGAELITNIHAFVTIVTNHAGSDLWWFDCPCPADTPEFYMRAILGSTAYDAGNDVVDYFHGYLNYQGEHHSFPDLSPLHYQRLHPRFMKVCKAYGVPYIKENIFIRTKKTADVMVGVAKHKVCKGFAVQQPKLWMIGKSKKQ